MDLQIIIRLTGLFVYRQSGNAVFALAPKTEHLGDDRHIAGVAVNEGIVPQTPRRRQEEGEFPPDVLNLENRHISIADGGSITFSLPSNIPDLKVKSKGALRSKLLTEKPGKDTHLFARARVRGIDDVGSRSGATFCFPNVEKPIPNEVYLKLRPMKRPDIELKATNIDDDGDVRTLTVKPLEGKSRICLTIFHVPKEQARFVYAKGQLKLTDWCTKHDPGEPISHFLSLYTLFDNIESNPAPHFHSCLKLSQPPFDFPVPLAWGVDPATCVGGGG
jgi:hypothetical protein